MACAPCQFPSTFIGQQPFPYNILLAFPGGLSLPAPSPDIEYRMSALEALSRSQVAAFQHQSDMFNRHLARIEAQNVASIQNLHAEFDTIKEQQARVNEQIVQINADVKQRSDHQDREIGKVRSTLDWQALQQNASLSELTGFRRALKACDDEVMKHTSMIYELQDTHTSMSSKIHDGLFAMNAALKEHKDAFTEHKSEDRGCSSGKSFRFVRACIRARSGCQVELDLNFRGLAFPLSPFAVGGFPFSLTPPPNLLSNFSWAYRCFHTFQDLQSSQTADEQSDQQERMSQRISALMQNTSSTRDDLIATIESMQQDSKKENECLDLRLNLALAIINERWNDAKEDKMLLRCMQRYMLHNNEEIQRMIHDSDVRIASVEGKIRQREKDELRMLKECRALPEIYEIRGTPEIYNIANSQNSSAGSAGSAEGKGPGSSTAEGWEELVLTTGQLLNDPVAELLGLSTDQPIKDPGAELILTVSASGTPDATNHDTRVAAAAVNFPWPA